MAATCHGEALNWEPQARRGERSWSEPSTRTGWPKSPRRGAAMVKDLLKVPSLVLAN
jgi:hypothetical protein